MWPDAASKSTRGSLTLSVEDWLCKPPPKNLDIDEEPTRRIINRTGRELTASKAPAS